MVSTIMFSLLLASNPLARAEVPIATFDGAAGTTLAWAPVNDPVMGGKSVSTFKVDSNRKLGVWDGEVAIVPFLKAPGFCNLQSPGLYKTADFPDVSQTDGIEATLREAHPDGLTKFRFMLMTKGAKQSKIEQDVYSADFVVGSQMKKIFVPWSAFNCTFRGEPVTGCPAITTQLNQITNVGFGTTFPGPTGKFTIEIEKVSAVKSDVVSEGSPDSIDIEVFNGKASHTWHSENDPVMGGKSSSSYVNKGSYGVYSGSCRIVPQLKAPGFTIVMTETPLISKFPDVSSMDGFSLGLKNIGGNITEFKFAFCDSRINYYRCQFQSFKADISVPKTGDVVDVFVPWSKFSDKWSSYTGEHTAENPPKATNLASITQLQLWTEGVLGDFDLELHYVRARKAPAAAPAAPVIV